MKKRVAVLGSTGSVGEQALRILADHQDRFSVAMLAAGRSAERLGEQVQRFRPAVAALSAGLDGPRDRDGATWFGGEDAVLEGLALAKPDLILNAITGAAGLPASDWSLRHGVDLALANKESLVIAGELLVGLAASSGAKILPVDSEHCAIFQCLGREPIRRVRRVWLTGSGGPFRERPLDGFASITPEQALRHPTWDMGARITIGSATMMNKAFEVVEARWLFDLEPERIQVVLHPQSIVHSMVEFVDGSIVAQLGVPDMRVPILFCLGWPDRLPFADFEPFDPVRFRSLSFEPVDPARYPAIGLGYEVLARGGDAGAVLNAADEVATGRFLDGRLPFTSIVATVADVLRAERPRPVQSIGDAQAADRRARRAAAGLLEALPY